MQSDIFKNPSVVKLKDMPESVQFGLKILRKAVYDELKRKAKLGQFAIVSINGKPRRVKAETLLRRGKKKGAVSISAGSKHSVQAD